MKPKYSQLKSPPSLCSSHSFSEGCKATAGEGGVRGTKIEPLVPLLTFIGDIDLDKSIENEQPMKENDILSDTPSVLKSQTKKKGLHI